MCPYIVICTIISIVITGFEEIIRIRGGNASNIRQLQTGMEKKTVVQLARDAANGDRKADAALKMIKQARQKGQEH